jgi:hypothetical protein
MGRREREARAPPPALGPRKQGRDKPEIDESVKWSIWIKTDEHHLSIFHNSNLEESGEKFHIRVEDGLSIYTRNFRYDFMDQ